jgi:hypothetical protein
MLFRKHIVSMRMLLQLAVASVLFVGGVGTVLAANSYTGAAPVLIPYVINGLAGNEQPAPGSATPNTTATAGGYSGDGLTGMNSTLNAPYALAVDAAGNIFIADTNNFIIRELNAQTGIIQTVAGVHPTVCGGAQGIACTKTVSNGPGTCSDGVPALNDPIGSQIHAITVDEYDNVYFGDAATFTISVIYHGGARVANFIKLVNPAAVAKAGGVIPGYVYHIAGTINLNTCVGTKGTTAANDNLLAFENNAPGVTGPAGAALDNTNPGSNGSDILLDSAGNIYLMDAGNDVIRVINTQSTPQQFFQYVVQPGYIKAIVNCGALTVPCAGPITLTTNTGLTLPPNTPQNPTTTVDGPADLVKFSPQYGMGVDGYGNIYQTNNSGASPNYYAGSIYAGGAPLAKLEGVLWKGVNIAYGDAYEVINDVSLGTSLPHYYDNVLANSAGTGGPIIRSTGIIADPLGNVWAMDNHWPSIFRVDVNSGILLDVVGYGGGNGSSSSTPLDAIPSGVDLAFQNKQYGTLATPIYCITGFGSSAFGEGQLSYDERLDGCPGIVADTSAGGMLVSDGFGNIFMADNGFNEVRELPLNNTFPATPVGVKVTQPIDIHFDASNPPAVLTGGGPGGSAANNVTSSITFTNGLSGTPITDFSIDTTDPEYPALLWLHSANSIPGSSNSNNGALTPSTVAMYAGPPACIQNAISAPDQSWDCLVYVTFDPSAPGLRSTQIQVTTQPVVPLGVAGPLPVQTYYFPLTGVGLGAQIAIDGGTPVPVQATGLGTTPAVAVATNGTIYIADPANNRIVACVPGVGSTTSLPCSTLTPLALAFSPLTFTPAQSTLNGPMGVAVDTANNIYISDTGNNRILEVTPLVQVLGGVTTTTYPVTVLGGMEWVSCAPTAAPLASPPIVGKPCPVVLPGTLPPANANISAAQTALGLPAPAAVTPGPIPVSNPLQQYLFKGPEGLAVDLSGNVYVADTGNSAVVIIPKNPVLGGAAPMFQYAGAPTFASPVAVAVDPQNNIYVADTGNPFQQVVKIPPGGGDLQTLLPLDSSLPLIGGQGLSTPSGVAVDGGGNVFISDAASNAVWEAPAAGPPTEPFQLTNITGLSSPLGLALDSGGNLYVANSGADQVLYVNRQSPTVNFGNVPQDLGAATGVPGTPSGCLNGSSTPCTGVLTLTNFGRATSVINLPFPTTSSLSVTTLSGSPVLTVVNGGSTAGIVPGVSIAGGTGTPQETLFIPNASNGEPSATVLSVTPTTITMSVNAAVTNTTPVTVTYLNSLTPVAISGSLALTSPAASITSGPATFALAGTTCGATLPPGATCTISPTYTPVANGAQSATLTVNGTQSVALVANGAPPQAKIVLTAVYSGGTPTAGGNATYTATVSQPHTPPGGTPTGTVTFTFTVDAGLYAAGACGTVASQTVTLVGGVASTSAVPIHAGIYVVTATYNSDANDSEIVSIPLTTTVPGLPITATISSPPPYVYGSPSPNLNALGTITGVDSTVTAKFVSGASQFSPVSGSPYPITVGFSGGDFCNYLSPTTGAFVTETPAPLSEWVPPITAPFGSPNINFALDLVYTGAVNNDQNAITPLFSVAPLNVTTVSGSAVLTVVAGGGNTGAATAGSVITGPGIPTNIFTGTTTLGSPTVKNVSSTTGLTAGLLVGGPGIVVGTKIASVGTGTITLSANAIASGTAVSLVSYTTVLSTTPTSVTISAPETETNSTAVPVSYLISPALAPPTTSTYASAAASSTLSLAGSPWTISPSLSGKPITVFGDYAVTYNPVTLTIIQAPTTIASAIAATTELPTVASGVAAVTKATDSISVGSAVPGGSGLPTGTVTVYDTITTLPNNGASGVGTVYLPCTLPLTANVSAGSSDIFVASNYDLFVGETVTGLSAFTASTTTGSPTLSAVSTSTTLYPGEIVTGAGIPSGSTIVGVGQGSITLSANATATAAGITVNAYVIPSGTTILFVGTTAAVPFTANTTNGSQTLTAVVNNSGNNFFPGAPISGPGIPTGSTILAVGTGTLTISAPATATGTAVALNTTTAPSITLSAPATASIPVVQLDALTAATPCTANTPSATITSGSPVLTAMSSILNIAAGEPISGPGIPVGATVVSLGTTQFIATTASSTTLTMVSPATTTGLGLTVGEPLTGIGIAPGATITAIASGTITMSTAASSSNTGITIYAGNTITISAPATATATTNTFTATTTPGSPVLTAVSSTANLFPGEPISGVGIPVSTTTPTTIVSVGTSTVTMSAAVPLTFPFTATIASGSPVLTAVVNTSVFTFAAGSTVTGPGIPSGTTIVSVGTGTITISAAATAAGTGVALSAATTGSVGENVTSPITVSTPYADVLLNGLATFTPTSVIVGLHQYSFAYSGDGNFLPSTLTPPGITPTTPPCAEVTTSGSTGLAQQGSAPCLLVDYGDFAISTTYGIVQIVPGVVPSGLSLLPAPLQNSSYPQSAAINFTSLEGETGPLSLTCLPIGNPYATPFTATTSSGSTTLTGISDTVTPGLTPGDIITGPGIPSNATIVSVGSTTITISSGATASGSGVSVSFIVPPPVGAGTSTIFTATTTFGSPVITGVSSVTGLTVGEPISGPGILFGSTIVAVGASTVTISANATASGAAVTLFSYTPPGGSVTASAASTSYITCSMNPGTVTLTSNANSVSVLAVQIPLTEPVNYQFFSQVRMPGSETLLAFLPLGALAFFVRRRRRLSKALWMLLLIAIVTTGMGGCGGIHYSVALQSPFPAGPQYIQITATGNSINAAIPAITRTFFVEIYIN